MTETTKCLSIFVILCRGRPDFACQLRLPPGGYIASSELLQSQGTMRKTGKRFLYKAIVFVTQFTVGKNVLCEKINLSCTKYGVKFCPKPEVRPFHLKNCYFKLNNNQWITKMFLAL